MATIVSGCRNFSYDGLGQLGWSLQPETANISYSGGGTTTASVSYRYDAGTNGIGHLTQASVAGGTVTGYSAFDAMGRITASTQQMAGGSTYGFTYGYDLAGNLTTETYPSGRQIQTSFDPLDRPVTVSGSVGGQVTPYVWNTNYAVGNNLYAFNYGNGNYRSYRYNQRLQLQEVTERSASVTQNCGQSPYVLDMHLHWGTNGGQTASNNGNLQSQTINGCAAPATAVSYTQTYGYDSVNRLAALTDSGGGQQSYSYDAYGNVWSSVSGSFPVNAGTPGTNVYNAANQLTTQTYDTAGNQTSLAGFCTNCLMYDAENRLTSASGGTPVSYAYDANGARVQKQAGSTTTVYVYDAFGALAAEYSSNAVAASVPCERCYLSWDHLGSTRLVTDVLGNAVSFHDYLGFGTELGAGYAGRGSQWGGTADGVEEKFTGQVRDGETGLDYFNARYFSGALGRFMSADPGNAGADPTDPQTWNAYSYVRNNPLVLVDPSGMDGAPADNSGNWLKNVFRWFVDTVFGSGQYPGCVAYGTEGCITNPAVTVTYSGSLSGGGSSTSATGVASSSSAGTSGSTPSQPPKNGTYKTLNCAGYTAARNILPQTKAKTIEFGGFIDKGSNGTYSYTAPFPGNRSSLPNFYDQYNNLLQSLPKGYSVAGWYHSHPLPPPTYPSSEAFSGQDLSVSHYINAPGFVVTPSGAVLRLDPGPPAVTTRVPTFVRAAVESGYDRDKGGSRWIASSGNV